MNHNRKKEQQTGGKENELRHNRTDKTMANQARRQPKTIGDQSRIQPEHIRRLGKPKTHAVPKGHLAFAEHHFCVGGKRLYHRPRHYIERNGKQPTTNTTKNQKIDVVSFGCRLRQGRSLDNKSVQKITNINHWRTIQ